MKNKVYSYDLYKEKVSKLISKAKEKGLIKKYEEFSETEEMKESALTDEEVEFYNLKKKEK